jgi:hypothetical protein
MAVPMFVTWVALCGGDGAAERKEDVLTSLQVRIERLRSEIAQLEARYDGVFPPGVYAVLERLRNELAELHKVDG